MLKIISFHVAKILDDAVGPIAQIAVIIEQILHITAEHLVIQIIFDGEVVMKPLIIAHRGASIDTPENTIPAFEAAIRLLPDGVETDIQLTKDGKMVLHHNYTIDACSDGSGSISNMTYDQLRIFDFGSYMGGQWKGTVIPNINEFMDTVKDNHGFALMK